MILVYVPPFDNLSVDGVLMLDYDIVSARDQLGCVDVHVLISHVDDIILVVCLMLLILLLTLMEGKDNS